MGHQRSKHLTAALSTQDDGVMPFQIPYLRRSNELAVGLTHLLLASSSEHSRLLIVQGDSGTGKTSFAKELARRLLAESPADPLCLYIDVPNDDYQSADILRYLMTLAEVPTTPTKGFPVQILESHAPSVFRRELGRRRVVGMALLRTVAEAAGSLVGLGGAVKSALEPGNAPTLSIDDEFYRYIKWVVKKSPVVVIVDNYQFLASSIRLSLEAIFHRLQSGVSLLLIDRTVDSASTLDPSPRIFASQSKSIALGPLQNDHVEDIVVATLGIPTEDAKRLASDLMVKSGGIAKDIEYCLRQIHLSGSVDEKSPIDGLAATLDRLPLIHQKYLMIATLLDGGVKPEVARNTVRRITEAYEIGSIDLALEDLLKHQYMRLNTLSGDRLRAGHERIVQAMRELAPDELHEQVRHALVDVLRESLESSESLDNETYILHCMIGLQTARELGAHLHEVAQLLRQQHQREQFQYIATIAADLRDVLSLLPESAVTVVLDAYQKSSQFEQGLALLRHLGNEADRGQSRRLLYRVKFLAQLYEYEEALDLIPHLDQDDPWTRVYEFGVHLSTGQRDEALELLGSPGASIPFGEPDAVMARNSVSLLEPHQALERLERAEKFFRNAASKFGVATVRTNRSVVLLSRGDYSSARSELDGALAIMRELGSSEVYQPILNLGITEALCGKLDLAETLLTQAADEVPRSLILDRVKITANLATVRFEKGILSLEELRSAFLAEINRLGRINVPYLRRAIMRNIQLSTPGELAPERHAGVADHMARVSIEWHAPSRAEEVGWDMPLSIHWRY